MLIDLLISSNHDNADSKIPEIFCFTSNKISYWLCKYYSVVIIVNIRLVVLCIWILFEQAYLGTSRVNRLLCEVGGCLEITVKWLDGLIYLFMLALSGIRNIYLINYLELLCFPSVDSLPSQVTPKLLPWCVWMRTSMFSPLLRMAVPSSRGSITMFALPFLGFSLSTVYPFVFFAFYLSFTKYNKCTPCWLLYHFI